jgi:hypothetical protein
MVRLLVVRDAISLDMFTRLLSCLEGEFPGATVRNGEHGYEVWVPDA